MLGKLKTQKHGYSEYLAGRISNINIKNSISPSAFIYYEASFN